MKTRLDIELVSRGLATGRDRAKSLIMSGVVYVNGQRADKAGDEIRPDDQIEIRGQRLNYVSRGGLKLERALSVFPISLDGAVCCDFGASTGGFTDCMLQNGANKVYCFDVGYGQLAWSLRQDERVINRERTNVRNLTIDDVDSPVDFISVDVSFISLALVLPAVSRLLKENGEAVCLIKPQFEAGRDRVGKHGVVKDKTTHAEVIQSVAKCALGLGFDVLGITYSPIKGPSGNIEYLLYLKKSPDGGFGSDVPKIVDEAHSALD